MPLIEEVIKMTLLNINEVQLLNVHDFLSYCSYCKVKIEQHNREVQEQMRKYRR